MVPCPYRAALSAAVNNDDDNNNDNRGIGFVDFRGKEGEDGVVSSREEENRVVFRGREGEEEEEEEDIAIAV
jgi:hypothetical protein